MSPVLKLVIFAVLIAAPSLAVEISGNAGENDCTSQKTCGSCFTAAHHCGWCMADGFDAPPKNYERCDHINNLKSYGCPEKYIVFPDHVDTVVRNDPLQNAGRNVDAIQIAPQEMHVHIRPNRPFKFNMTFREAENYPVDLYYLMDLSNSMEDDKDKIAALGNLLAKSMSEITENFRLGFGSFVDKKVMPYVSTVPRKLQEPCPNCVPPYGFLNHMPLTENTAEFSDQVDAAKVSGNLDGPEGGFDAIMQAIVCDDQIGWRDRARRMLVFSTDHNFHLAGDGKKQVGWRSKSRKMVVFSTDSGFHYAGDGKLGGIVKPNDGECHLDSTGLYTESTTQDYPSISQIASKIAEHKVNVIFAVTKDQVPIYGQLSSFIEGSTSGELANDSSNVVQLVRDNYNKITSKVSMHTTGAENITVKFKSQCLGNQWMDTNSCGGLKIGSNITFEVSVSISECPKDPAQRKRQFAIYPVGLTERLVLNLEMQCDCDCEKEGAEVPNSPLCSDGNGTFECGQCTCNQGRYGKFCECDGSDASSEDYDAACRQTNSSEVCSGFGRCVCGECECNQRGQIAGQKYSGKFCQCDDYSCSRAPDNSEICGGPERGKCKCGNCTCNDGFEGPSCDCPISKETCRASNGVICNGKGTCTCGVCTCTLDTYYSGPTCEDCPTCPGKCEASKACVQCHAFSTGPLDEDYCKANCTNIDMVSEAKATDQARLCQFTDEDDCTFYFTYEYDQYGNILIKAQRTKLCPTAVNVLAIVLGVIGGIVAVGLFLLLIWKLWTTIHDRREVAKFEKERQNAKWDTGENPIYKHAISTYKNPTYAGK